MRDLGLDIGLAQQIAVGLSTVHWEACLDGGNIEFVPRRPAAAESQTHLWILNFDKTWQFSLMDGSSAILDLLIPAVHGLLSMEMIRIIQNLRSTRNCGLSLLLHMSR